MLHIPLHLSPVEQYVLIETKAMDETVEINEIVENRHKWPVKPLKTMANLSI